MLWPFIIFPTNRNTKRLRGVLQEKEDSHAHFRSVQVQNKGSALNIGEVV
jgi:hypothetical protein